MSKKHIYFYGDSYTAGHGLLPPTIYKKVTKPKGTEHFTARLKEYFKADQAHYRAINGNSNDHILYQLTEDIPHITSGSTIVVGMSAPTRSSLYVHKTKNSTLEHEFLASKGPNKVLNKKSSLLHVSVHLPEVATEKLIGTNLHIQNLSRPLNPEMQKFQSYSSTLFLKNHATPSFIEAYESAANYNVNVKGLYFGEWTLYWRTVAEGILNLAKRAGIEIILWDWTVWCHYETIQDATKGTIEDGHWSWKGQSDFCKDLIAAYENNQDIHTYLRLEDESKRSIENMKAKKLRLEHRRNKFNKQNSK